MMTAGGFWTGKRVLVTGHTGFKGSWLCLWLQQLGADVTGIALPPDQRPALFDLARVASGMTSHFCDMRDAEAFARHVRAAKPDIVIHMAAQALVRASYRDPLGTFAANVMGTAHLLEALRGLGARVAVMVTTDKVYHNHEWAYPYRESDALGGYDPYSASKAASEIVIASYRDSFLRGERVAIASARAGNVIGGGDWSEDRLIPDAIRAWQAGKVLEIRRPQAIRPWQHVLEPVHGYLTLAEKLWNIPAMEGAYNIGPHTHEAATVRDVIEIARQANGGGEIEYGDGHVGPHEASWLALETAKARTLLGLAPRWPIETAVRRTIEWYRARHEGADARDLCEKEIAAYEAAA